LLVGAGGIAPEYVKALRALGHEDISVLSRTEDSAARFAERLRLRAHFGGGAERLKQVAHQFDAAILAANIEALVPLMEAWQGPSSGRPLLVEKPVALS